MPTFHCSNPRCPTKTRSHRKVSEVRQCLAGQVNVLARGATLPPPKLASQYIAPAVTDEQGWGKKYLDHLRDDYGYDIPLRRDPRPDELWMIEDFAEAVYLSMSTPKSMEWVEHGPYRGQPAYSGWVVNFEDPDAERIDITREMADLLDLPDTTSPSNKKSRAAGSKTWRRGDSADEYNDYSENIAGSHLDDPAERTARISLIGAGVLSDWQFDKAKETGLLNRTEDGRVFISDDDLELTKRLYPDGADS